MRVLAWIAATVGYGPEVHRPVTVTEKIQSAIPEHRVLAGALVVGRQLCGLLVAFYIPPQILCGAALVPLGVAALEGKPREVQGSAVWIVRAVTRLRERKDRASARRRVHACELR